VLPSGRIRTAAKIRIDEGGQMSQAQTSVRVRARSAVFAGVGAGILGAALMAAFAMTASATYHGTGFFTPLYHIAASILSPDTMMASATEAQAGNPFHLVALPALAGILLHLSVGAVFGAVFPLVGRLLGVRRWGWLALGITYGAAVLLLMSFVGLPIAAALFGGGDPIANMPELAGWWTFGIEHVLFGSVLGLVFVSSGRGRIGDLGAGERVRAGVRRPEGSLPPPK
jgi:hypothetical protein